IDAEKRIGEAEQRRDRAERARTVAELDRDNAVERLRQLTTTKKAPVEFPNATVANIYVNQEDGSEYVLIPAGSFRMGCVPADNNCSPEEQPAHPVNIENSFLIGRTEVTVRDFEKFVRARKETMPSPKDVNPNWGEQNQPMVNVSWDQAQNYCNWVGGRLP